MDNFLDKSRTEDSSSTLAKPNETLVSWLLSLGKSGIKSIPQMAKVLGIQLGIVFAVNLVFWWEGIADHIPNFIKLPIVFLTATRNGIVSKTIYWAIVFSFGKKLISRIKSYGFRKTFLPIVRLVPELKLSFKALSTKAIYLMLIGGGIGLAAANYFASYGTDELKINKIDKYFVAILISFTISYLLGEGRRHWIFKFSRLSTSDASRLLRRESTYTDEHTYILMSGFVTGLLADAPLIFLNSKIGGIKYINGSFRDNLFVSYLGYYIGAALLVAGIVLLIILAFTKRKKA